MIACTLFLPIFTAAKDEKYFMLYLITGSCQNLDKIEKKNLTQCVIFFRNVSDVRIFVSFIRAKIFAILKNAKANEKKIL